MKIVFKCSDKTYQKTTDLLHSLQNRNHCYNNAALPCFS